MSQNTAHFSLVRSRKAAAKIKRANPPRSHKKLFYSKTFKISLTIPRSRFNIQVGMSPTYGSATTKVAKFSQSASIHDIKFFSPQNLLKSPGNPGIVQETLEKSRKPWKSPGNPGKVQEPKEKSKNPLEKSRKKTLEKSRKKT